MEQESGNPVQDNQDQLKRYVLKRQHVKAADFLKRSLDSKSKHLQYFNTEYQLALHARDACMIKLFLMHHQKLKRTKHEILTKAFFSDRCLASLPDMRLCVRWHCDSDFIPFLSRLAPHDTIQIYKSQRFNILRIDFSQTVGTQQGTSQEASRAGRRAMSLVFKDNKIQLVDHKSKTISCDLYELLAGGQTQEDDHVDGQAFELANSNTLSEKQIIKLIAERQISQTSESVKKKIEIALQQWERRRREESEDNPQQEDNALSSLFKDVLVSDKQLAIDVSLQHDNHLNQSHILKTLELLSTIYPEVKKVRKLAAILMQSQHGEWIPSEIKIPVVSSLGIKAVVKIGEVDYTPFREKEAMEVFMDFYNGYSNVDLTGNKEYTEMLDQIQSPRGQLE